MESRVTWETSAPKLNVKMTFHSQVTELKRGSKTERASNVCLLIVLGAFSTLHYKSRLKTAVYTK